MVKRARNWWTWGLLAASLLGGCAVTPPAPEDIASSRWASQTNVGDAPRAWEHYVFPGKASTNFNPVRFDGRDAIRAEAASSASMLRIKTRIEPAELGHVRFSWRVPGLIAAADLAQRDADDSPARVVLVFDGDRSRFSSKDAMLSELVRTVTGEEMPYATLMYVWCNKREPGTVVMNPRTSRVRTIVVESGAGNLDRWLDYDRDVRADYERAFGELPGALLGIAVMTDSDNTRSVAHAWYGPIQLPRSRPKH